jgi:hypothetical protein
MQVFGTAFAVIKGTSQLWRSHQGLLMDHDAGWAAQDITLTTQDVDGQHERLVLPCRWVEYIQTWDGNAPPFFLVSVHHSDGLTGQEWRSLTFKDGSGKAHRYQVKDAREIAPLKVRLTRVR